MRRTHLRNPTQGCQLSISQERDEKMPMPLIHLRLFKINDPLQKTRAKKIDVIRTQPISQSMDDINLNRVKKSNKSKKTKEEFMQEIQGMEDSIYALKHFKKLSNDKVFDTRNSSNSNSFSFFYRKQMQKELSKEYLKKRGKLVKQKQVENKSLSSEQLLQASSQKISPQRKMQMRTILSNKIREQLLQNIKNPDASITTSKFKKKNISQWANKFPEIKNLILSNNIIKKKKYKNSLNSRLYNPYYAYLARSPEGRKSIIINFQQRTKKAPQ